MNVLVIGGTGFISTRVVDFLSEAGHAVTMLNRGKSNLGSDAEVELLQADRHDEDRVARLLSGRRFDAVYDMVAYAPEESISVLRLLDGKAERFIHCSTISVYMVSNEVQCPITEDQAKRPEMTYFPRNPFGMDYGIQKRLCEDALWKAHEEGRFKVTMLRPPFVCGPRDPMIRDLFWIERIRDGGPLLVPGCGDHALQHVFVDDVARAFVDLLAHPSTEGRPYNVAAEEIFTLNEYLQKLSRLLGREPEFVHVPQAVFDRLPFSTNPRGDVFPFNARRTAILSLNAIQRDLGYEATPFDRWMPETIDWYDNNCRRSSHGYDLRPDEIAFARTWSKQFAALLEESVPGSRPARG